jgi:hypothetical protein
MNPRAYVSQNLRKYWQVPALWVGLMVLFLLGLTSGAMWAITFNLLLWWPIIYVVIKAGKKILRWLFSLDYYRKNKVWFLAIAISWVPINVIYWIMKALSERSRPFCIPSLLVVFWPIIVFVITYGRYRKRQRLIAAEQMRRQAAHNRV